MIARRENETGAYFQSFLRVVTRDSPLQNPNLLLMSTDGLPTPDDRARYETLRAELLKSLEKKRTADKQLVCDSLHSILGSVELMPTIHRRT